MAVKSSHNVPAESMWRWLLKTTGRDFKEVLLEGHTNGVFDMNSETHKYVQCLIHRYLNTKHPHYRHLFHWLWSKILQHYLDLFKTYWNYKEPRTQKTKEMANGMPIQIMENPQRFQLADWRVNVQSELVQALRSRLVPREDALRWVPVEFETLALEVYISIGSPFLNSALTGWNIFSRMAPILDTLYLT